MNPALESQIHSQVVAAIERKDVDEFQRLVKEYPEWPTSHGSLGYPHDIATDSLETFKAFVDHFPQTKDWDCGHTGNPVGIAAIRGDVPLLKYLLDDLGHKANEGLFCYSPVLHCVYKHRRSANGVEVVRILKAHGATLEGEGYFCQISHRKLNGKRCWHRRGKPNRPDCLWSADKGFGLKGFIWGICSIFGRNDTSSIMSDD